VSVFEPNTQDTTVLGTEEDVARPTAVTERVTTEHVAELGLTPQSTRISD